MKNSGVTLIEVIVTATISVILAGTAFALLFVANDQTIRTTLGTKMSLYSDIVVSSIGLKARSARFILNEFDTYPPMDTLPSTTKLVWMKKYPNIIVGGFRVEGSYLQEYVDQAWKNFNISGTDVKVTPSSNFSVSNDRKQITLNINIIAEYINNSDTMYSSKEIFLCRN